MQARIVYYTGTGNALWVARLLARELKAWQVDLVPMVASTAESGGRVDATGLAFPVHMWGLPARVARFARELDPGTAGYLFALAVNGGQPAGALPQLARLLRRQGAVLGAGFSITMPSNYTPFGGPGTPEQQSELFEGARAKVREVARCLEATESRRPERGSVAQRVFGGAVYRMTRPLVHRMDRFFRADERCTGCGVCERVCPARNVRMEDGRPRWLRGCEQCYACLQWCPEEAIQYGRSTVGRERYRHPQITRDDMLRAFESPSPSAMEES